MKTIIGRGAVLACVALLGMSTRVAADESTPALPDCPSLSQPMLPEDPPASDKPLDATQAIALLEGYGHIYARHLREIATCSDSLKAIEDAVPANAPVTSANLASYRERTHIRDRIRTTDLDELTRLHHLARAVSDRSTPAAQVVMTKMVADAVFDDTAVEQARLAESAFQAAMDRRLFLLIVLVSAHEHTMFLPDEGTMLAEVKQKEDEALAEQKAYHAALDSLRHPGIALPTWTEGRPSSKTHASVATPPPPPAQG